MEMELTKSDTLDDHRNIVQSHSLQSYYQIDFINIFFRNDDVAIRIAKIIHVIHHFFKLDNCMVYLDVPHKKNTVDFHMHAFKSLDWACTSKNVQQYQS